jgi:hypothetical protein
MNPNAVDKSTQGTVATPCAGLVNFAALQFAAPQNEARFPL